MPSIGNDELIAWPPWYRARERLSTRGRSRVCLGGVGRGGERGDSTWLLEGRRCRELHEVDVGADGDRQRPLAFVQVPVDGVGHAAALRGDLQRRRDRAERPLRRDAAPL